MAPVSAESVIKCGNGTGARVTKHRRRGGVRDWETNRGGSIDSLSGLWGEFMASAESELIKGVWGFCPSGVPGQSPWSKPLVRGLRPVHEADEFSANETPVITQNMYYSGLSYYE